jgi:hypothetical protein
MKPFSALVILRAPPEILFAAMRDRLGEIAPQLKDISAIDEIERCETAAGIAITNRWQARQTVPALLQARLGARDIAWIDHAVWDAATLTCRWTIEPLIGNGAVTCTGSTRFEPAMAGRGCRALFDGTLAIDPAFIGSVVGAIEAPVTALVQAVATVMIPSNFRAAAEAAAKLG